MVVLTCGCNTKFANIKYKVKTITPKIRILSLIVFVAFVCVVFQSLVGTWEEREREKTVRRRTPMTLTPVPGIILLGTEIPYLRYVFRNLSHH